MASPSSADRIRGTRGDDHIIGTQRADVIRALPGHDRVRGRHGADVIKGGLGADVLRGGPGPDLLLGRGGNDILDGGLGADRLWAGAGFGHEFDDGPGNDVVHGSAQEDGVIAGDGADRIFTGAHADFVSIDNDGDADVIDCGPGSDYVFYRPSIDRHDTLAHCENVQVDRI
jgi:Ca2+-binding RTX toxin-like protein